MVFLTPPRVPLILLESADGIAESRYERRREAAMARVEKHRSVNMCLRMMRREHVRLLLAAMCPVRQVAPCQVTWLLVLTLAVGGVGWSRLLG